MNQAKFEKIDGREALKRLLDGEKVYSCESERYRLDPNGHLYYIPNPTHHEILSFATIQDILSVNWYVPKPFDVRQTMLDRPNEWVGAFESSDVWYKVGFDSESFKAVFALYDFCDSPNHRQWGVSDSYRQQLDICIPIEDVPEEATR
ncbi:hypothetical protein [Exiguobacterium sp. s183]|uniref:hypothetical protein n=1 Tax=Exiguobacterium sp. s183 TaxID=2751262 RepID=UPI001BED3B65|nr:hypothetical protein [Exiguobacterium sp. s183]